MRRLGRCGRDERVYIYSIEQDKHDLTAYPHKRYYRSFIRSFMLC